MIVDFDYNAANGLSAELAHMYVVSHFNNDMKRIIEYNENHEGYKYTNEAQKVFDEHYERIYKKFFKEIENKPQPIEVARYLTFYQRWRKGIDEEFKCPGYVNERVPNPKELSQMIEFAIFYLTKLENKEK